VIRHEILNPNGHSPKNGTKATGGGIKSAISVKLLSSEKNPDK